MKLTTFQNRLTGKWVGSNSLWRNWLPTPKTVSDSRLLVNTVTRSKFLSFAYTWNLEGEEHEGFLLVGNENDTEQVSGAWCDSWHQAANLMILAGSVEETGAITLQGTFPAPPQPDWGWKIRITQPTLEELQISMYVIPWNETEQLAAQADYTRVPSTVSEQ